MPLINFVTTQWHGKFVVVVKTCLLKLEGIPTTLASFHRDTQKNNLLVKSSSLYFDIGLVIIYSFYRHFIVSQNRTADLKEKKTFGAMLNSLPLKLFFAVFSLKSTLVLFMLWCYAWMWQGCLKLQPRSQGVLLLLGQLHLQPTWTLEMERGMASLERCLHR